MSVYLHLDSLAREDAFICNSTYTVDFATIASLPPSTLLGNELTANANGVLVVDGVRIPLHSTVLVKDQLNPVENGLYKLTQLGTATQPWILTRYTLVNGTVVNVPLDPNSLSIRVNTPEQYRGNSTNYKNRFTIDFGVPPSSITIGTDPFDVVLGCKYLPNDVRRFLSLSTDANAVVTTATGENLVGYVGNTIVGITVVNGLTLTNGDIVIVKDQTNPIENGVYTFAGVTLTRIIGLDTGDTFTIGGYTVLDVSTGTYYTITTDGIVGTDPILFNVDLGSVLTNGVFDTTNEIQMPTNYRVYFDDLNCPSNKRTIGFRAHCKDTPENLTYSVEFCTVILPSITLVQEPIYNDENSIISFDYTSILNEPYIYVRLRSIDHAYGDLITTNNPPAEEATFVAWRDKYDLGSNTEINPDDDPIIFPSLTAEPRWVIYKSCMVTTMRLNLRASSWEVRIYDRYGRDLVLLESAPVTITQNPPPVDRFKQTMITVGIRPNYPV